MREKKLYNKGNATNHDAREYEIPHIKSPNVK